MTYHLGPVRDYAHAALLQECFEGGLPVRDLDDVVGTYCIAKLAYASGEDEAGDAAWQRLKDETDADEFEQIEAQLESDHPNIAAWVGVLVAEAERLDRKKAKRAAQVMV